MKYTLKLFPCLFYLYKPRIFQRLPFTSKPVNVGPSRVGNCLATSCKSWSSERNIYAGELLHNSFIISLKLNCDCGDNIFSCCANVTERSSVHAMLIRGSANLAPAPAPCTAHEVPIRNTLCYSKNSLTQVRTYHSKVQSKGKLWRLSFFKQLFSKLFAFCLSRLQIPML